jgi:hypothetical protein
VRVVVTAVSVDAALSLVGYYSGRGADVDLRALPPGDLERTTLHLALLVRRCLGRTADERDAELAQVSLDLQFSGLDHPEVLDVALALVALVTVAGDDAGHAEALRMLLATSAAALELIARRLAWLARGLLGDDDGERDRALANLSLSLQLAQLAQLDGEAPDR